MNNKEFEIQQYMRLLQDQIAAISRGLISDINCKDTETRVHNAATAIVQSLIQKNLLVSGMIETTKIDSDNIKVTIHDLQLGRKFEVAQNMVRLDKEIN